MKHRVYIYDRGGATLVGELLNVVSVKWHRVRDDTSTAHVVVQAADCAGILHYRHVGRYEMVITRNGKREWEGPITYMRQTGPRMLIDAKDVTHYLNRQPLTQTWDNSYPRVAFCVDRIQAIIQAEMAPHEALNPPINVVPNMETIRSPDSARTTKKTLPFQKYVWQELDDMAWRNGIDYSVTRRTLLINDVHDTIATTRTLTQADFGDELNITAYGMELATRASVTDGEGRAGTYGPAVDPYYGIYWLLSTEYDEGDNAVDTPISELQSQAQRIYTGRNPTPVTMRAPENSTLEPCTVDELWPMLFAGVKMPVRVESPYMPKVEQIMHLNRLTVFEDDGGETVQVSIASAAGEMVTEEP